jgi:hypothetical protein
LLLVTQNIQQNCNRKVAVILPTADVTFGIAGTTSQPISIYPSACAVPDSLKNWPVSAFIFIYQAQNMSADFDQLEIHRFIR